MFTWGQVTNQNTIISVLSQCLYSQDLPGSWHTVRNSQPYIYMTPQWGGHVRWHNKSHTLYLHLQETCGHQTRQGVVLLWEAPTHKATWPFDQRDVTRQFEKFKLPLSQDLELLKLGSYLWEEVQHANA